jgi:superfamily II DNA or RNA helicase
MPTDLQEQIERRRQRSQEEILKISNRGSHPLFSQFEVKSVSGNSYRVEIRSLDELQNTCTCPDYKTNLIGTCKHIEGVLIYLKKEYADRLEALAKKRPRGVKVYLHYGMEITVRVELPLPEHKSLNSLLTRYFDPSGVLAGAPLQSLPPLFAALGSLPGRERSLVVVDEAVREYLALLQDREEIQKQKEWFVDQVERGNRTMDVISTRLYPYQVEGAMHLAFGRRAMLADDMGLGKTVQAIAAAALLKQLRDIQQVLIICPASLKSQWAREIRRFTSLSVTVVEGTLLDRRKHYNDSSYFKIINYELVRHDIPELFKLHPDLVILDEAQRIKNWRTKTAQMVKSLPGRYAFVLTGTPLENRIDELYSIFQFLDPRILGPLWHFNDRFYELERRSSGGYKVLGYKNLDELRAIVSPSVLRRTRAEVLNDLPVRTDNNFFVEMTDPQWQAYNEYKESLARLIAKAQRMPLTPKEREILMLCLIKMRLICNALALHDKELLPKDRERTSPKLGELEEILTEEIASNGHKAVVFSQWAGMLALTEPIIQRVGLGYVKLTGAVPSSKRSGLIEQFFNDPECRVFLSTDAGGVGLNLQAASLVINLDLPWNPAVLEQRIARAHRHGQRHSVQVINLIAKDTIEERMLDTLAAKRDLFASVFGSEEAPIAIHFEDTGQGLLKQLSELLKKPVEVELELAPAVLTPEEATAAGEAVISATAERPAFTLKSFSALLLDRLPGKVLVVRQAPTGEGILVVVSGVPSELRPMVESALGEYHLESPPTLHLMEAEGYQALLSFLPPAARLEKEVFHADALPKAGPSGRELFEARLKRVNEGLAFAEKRLSLAEVVLKGGFPEEMLRPIREALGWGYSSLLALYQDFDPAADLPSPRRIHAGLVEPGHLPDGLAARLSRVRELTTPPEPGDEAPPPSLQTGETLAAAVQELLDLVREQMVTVSL